MKEEEEIVSSRNLRGKLVEARNSKDLPPPSLRRRRIYHCTCVSRARKSFVVPCSPIPLPLSARETCLSRRGSVYCYSPLGRIDEGGMDRRIELRRGNDGEGKGRREDRSLDLEGDGLWERLTRLMGPRHPGKYRRYPASIEVRLGCEPGCRCRFT